MKNFIMTLFKELPVVFICVDCERVYNVYLITIVKVYTWSQQFETSTHTSLGNLKNLKNFLDDI